ncbi:hypothetical protein AGMMS49942_23520 [Spirochaetia bacterium]|nr:hypothetical protein AGMMS49942_23520 [Spirochaetia bacterium]
MKKRVLIGGMLALVLAFGMVTGCSTFATVPASGGAEYEILGYLGSSYGSHDEAFTAAKQQYPEAQGVVIVTGKADNNLIPQKLVYGFYAIKFVKGAAAKKGLFGLF